jgi:hypothetical protein
MKMRTDFNYSEQDRVIFNFMTTVNKCDFLIAGYL